jgi:hypothetical protein
MDQVYGNRGAAISYHTVYYPSADYGARIAIIRPHALALNAARLFVPARDLTLFNEQRFSRSLARSFYGHLSSASRPLPSSSPVPVSTASMMMGGKNRALERQFVRQRNYREPGSRARPDIMSNKVLRHVLLYIAMDYPRG